MPSWKDAHLQAIGLQEVRYTNIYNKIKGIKNLSRKDADMIAAIDPFILGKVIEALAPMYENVNEGRNIALEVDWEHGDPSSDSVEWEDLGVYVLDYDRRKNKMTIAGEKTELEFWLTSVYGMDKNPAKAAIRSGRRIK